ncbi:MAG TPA: MBOAT family protein, partial [Niabella sp.]|nr:MBOAT family protein [Niabella sp.]
MLFNSVEYAIFLPVVFLVYWFLLNKSLTLQNIFILLVSYLFYSFWDWRFLFLLAFSTFLDFFTGLRISNATSAAKRKTWLFISVFVNLGFLGFFKYYNFFIESFADLLGAMGLKAHLTTLNIILPVGISFYTFHGLSYVFDIYNNKIRPTTNWIDYALFVSFFPLLVAGP